MIKNIILDWHGVLDETSPKSLTPYLIKLFLIQIFRLNFLACKQILLILFDKYTDLINQYNKNTKSPVEFWNTIYNNLGEKLGENLKIQIFKITLNKQLINLLQKKNQTLYILSDCSVDKKEIILKNLPPLNFKRKFFSCDSKTLKRDKSLFEFAIHEENLEPKDCLFIDDSLKNVEVANELGFQTFLFTGTKNNIKALNLLLNE